MQSNIISRCIISRGISDGGNRLVSPRLISSEFIFSLSFSSHRIFFSFCLPLLFLASSHCTPFRLSHFVSCPPRLFRLALFTFSSSLLFHFHPFFCLVSSRFISFHIYFSFVSFHLILFHLFSLSSLYFVFILAPSCSSPPFSSHPLALFFRLDFIPPSSSLFPSFLFFAFSFVSCLLFSPQSSCLFFSLRLTSPSSLLLFSLAFVSLRLVIVFIPLLVCLTSSRLVSSHLLVKTLAPLYSSSSFFFALLFGSRKTEEKKREEEGNSYPPPPRSPITTSTAPPAPHSSFYPLRSVVVFFLNEIISPPSSSPILTQCRSEGLCSACC